MKSAKRGGQILSTGKIGFVKPIRQQMMLPGETLDCMLKGSVRMGALRERDSLRINAHIALFMTPIRWLWDGWPQYVQEGPDGLTSPPTFSGNPGFFGLGSGIGAGGLRPLQTFWRDAPLRIYNEWYKWPEDPDVTVLANSDGFPAVPLSHTWTRCRDVGSPADAADTEVASAVTMNVQELAETQAKYRSAVERDILSYGRYQELLQEMFGANGSREVDQVPIKVSEAKAGVDPREIPATDSAGLGQWMSIFDFKADHGFEVSAPEHCILTYMLCVRFPSITEEVHPLASPQDLSWAEQVGDPGLLSVMPPQPVTRRMVFSNNNVDQLGFLPAGWQWRAQNNIVGQRIDDLDSFPILTQPTNSSDARDATRRNAAFRSQQLGDFTIDMYATENSYQPIPSALTSHYIGMGNAGRGSKTEFPGQGKVK